MPDAQWDLPSDNEAFRDMLTKIFPSFDINTALNTFMRLPIAQNMPDTLHKSLFDDETDVVGIKIVPEDIAEFSFTEMQHKLMAMADYLEVKGRHVRTPSAWPGNPPVGTPLPLPHGFGGGNTSGRDNFAAPAKPVKRRKRKRSTTSLNGYRPATQEEIDAIGIGHWTEQHVLDVPDVMALFDSPTPVCIAKGRDKRGKLQPKYNKAQNIKSGIDKYARNTELVGYIDNLLASARQDAKENDTAAALLLIAESGMRNGHDLDAKDIEDNKRDLAKAIESGTYDPATYEPPIQQAHGATNLRVKHVTITRDKKIRVQAKGKKQVDLDLLIDPSPELLSAVQSRLKGGKPDDRLFDTSDDFTNKYLKEHTGNQFVVKDLRTLKAAELTRLQMATYEDAPATPEEFIERRNAIAKVVSTALGNTPKVAIESYIDPMLFGEWRNPTWGKIKGDHI